MGSLVSSDRAMNIRTDIFLYLCLVPCSRLIRGQPAEDLMMMESREAAPERSSFDAEQFNMATSYLKSQFSIPHHLVPNYEDVRATSLLKRRLSTSSANVENHRFNPDISPYDSINEDVMYKKSRANSEYKNANIYQMERSESGRGKDNSFQQILNKRKEIRNEIKDKFGPMKVPRKNHVRSRRPLPPTGERPSLLSAILGFTRSKHQPQPQPPAGYLRRNIPPNKRQSHIDRRIDVRNPRLEKRRNQSGRQSSTLSRRRILSAEQEERKANVKTQKSSSQQFDGLALDFWQDEESQATSPKPDYKRRWQNLSSDYIPKNQTRGGEERSDQLDSLSPVFSDWGDSMWAEIHQDWDDNEKLQEGIVSKAKQEINNNRKVERRKIPTRSRRPSRQRF